LCGTSLVRMMSTCRKQSFLECCRLVIQYYPGNDYLLSRSFTAILVILPVAVASLILSRSHSSQADAAGSKDTNRNWIDQQKCANQKLDRIRRVYLVASDVGDAELFAV
jgi:hypothetical protein